MSAGDDEDEGDDAVEGEDGDEDGLIVDEEAELAAECAMSYGGYSGNGYGNSSHHGGYKNQGYGGYQ